VLIAPVPVVSVLIVAEDEFVDTVVVSLVAVVLPLPHAAKAPKTNTNNSFFIFLLFCLFVYN
jgi:hypothetical protein